MLLESQREQVSLNTANTAILKLQQDKLQVLAEKSNKLAGATKLMSGKKNT